jgi:hypothetical protein
MEQAEIDIERMLERLQDVRRRIEVLEERLNIKENEHGKYKDASGNDLPR